MVVSTMAFEISAGKGSFSSAAEASGSPSVAATQAEVVSFRKERRFIEDFIGDH